MSSPVTAETAVGHAVDRDPVVDAPSARKMWVILVLVLVADALDLLDATITNIAAPTIVEDIGGGQGLVKWLTAA